MNNEIETTPTRVEKLKNHIKTHKEKYIVGAVTFTIGCVAGALLVKKYNVKIETQKKVFSPFCKDTINNTQINIRQMNVGPTSSKPVFCIEDRKFYDSRIAAAMAEKVNPIDMCNAVNHGTRKINGKTFIDASH